MVDDANPTPPSTTADPADEARFVAISDALLAQLDAVVPGWIAGLVVDRVRGAGREVTTEVAVMSQEAGEAAHDEVMPALRALLDADVDDQAANPLSLLRAVTGHATATLAGLGVPAVERDEFHERSFPDDVYGLAPAAWADVDPSLHELGITWGAAKAFLHKARRRAGGHG